MTSPTQKGARGAKVTVKCKRCGDPFRARVADRKRGWGLFCSKSCKAIRQTQQTGYAGPASGDFYAMDEAGHDGHKGQA
jgi:hypothetical protein